MHTFVHENLKVFVQGFRYDAHPMGMLLATVGALSTFYPDAKNIGDPEERRMAANPHDRQDADARRVRLPPQPGHAVRLPRQRPRLRRQLPADDVQDDRAQVRARSSPLAKALDTLFILHADHEQNCSTAAVRAVGSSQVDPYSAVAAGVAALYGPLHGGANEAVLRMLARIKSVENIPDFLASVKAGNERLMGFGHRVYKNFDPRAQIIKKHVDEVLEVTGTDNPLLEIAVELEKQALDDEYFTSRKLYPNVDFYSGLIYEALQIPRSMFTVMFAIPRTSGWIAQWLEMLDDPETKIARPRQIYTGHRDRDFLEGRKAVGR